MAAGLVLISTLTGCTYAFDVPLREVPKLSADTPPFGEPHVVTTLDGEQEAVGERFKVTVIPKGELMPWARPIIVQGPLIARVEEPMLILQGKGREAPVHLPTRLIRAVRVEQVSTGRVTLIILGIIAGTAVTAGLIGGLAASH